MQEDGISFLGLGVGRGRVHTSLLRQGVGKVHTARLLLHMSSKPVDPSPHTH